MNPAQALWLTLMAGALFGLVVGWWVGALAGRRMAAKAGSDERLRLVGWEARKIMHESELATYTAEVGRLGTLYQEECRKREEQFRMIEGIQKERDGWKDIFWQCSGEHGVAQEYMVRVNQYFAKICGKNPDAKMPAMRKAFEEKYGTAAKLGIAARIERGLPGLLAPGESAPVTVPSGAVAHAAENAEAAPVVVAKDDPNA